VLEIPLDRRRAEKALWAEFEAARPRMLGALLGTVCAALRHLPAVKQRPDAPLGRMADFDQWGAAVEGALGWAPGTFAAAYAASRERATHAALESSPVAEGLRKCLGALAGQGERMERALAEGLTSTEWLGYLDWYNPDGKRAPGWPRTPNALGQTLGRLAPDLRRVGITAERTTRGTGTGKR
jgi:hypothetical protein